MLDAAGDRRDEFVNLLDREHRTQSPSQSARNAHRYTTSTRTIFERPDKPDLIVTADFGHRKCSATSATSSTFAFPSTGGDRNCARHEPSGSGVNRDARAFGFTLIRRIMASPIRRTGFDRTVVRDRMRRPMIACFTPFGVRV